MDRQIVDPDPGKITTRESPLATRTSKWKKNIYIAVVQIAARLRIVMVDGTVLVQFW